MKVPRDCFLDNSYKVLFECGYFPLVMVQGTITWCAHAEKAESGTMSQELYISPAVLCEHCTAESLWTVLKQKLPLDWNELAQNFSMVVLLLGHDSHSGNLRLIRGIVERAAGNVLVISSRCAMHQLQRALCTTYAAHSLAFHGQLFCMYKLIHNGVIMKGLRELFHKLVQANFRVCYSEPDAVSTQWSRRLFLLLHVQSDVEEDDDGALGEKQRFQEMCRFLRIFNGNLQQRKPMWHHCNADCVCIDEADSLQRAHAAIDELILRALPEIARMDRWTKYQAPSKKICLAFAVHFILCDAFLQYGAEDIKVDVEQEFDNLLKQILQTETDGSDAHKAEFQHVKQTRMQYTVGFASNPKSLRNLVQCVWAIEGPPEAGHSMGN